jgi:hypothetical protein
MNRDELIAWAMMAALPGVAGCVIERDVPANPYGADAGIEDSVFFQASSEDAPDGVGDDDAPPLGATGGSTGSGVGDDPAPTSGGQAPRDAGTGSADSGSALDPSSIPDRTPPPSANTTGSGDAGTTCAPPTVTGCNPVSNDGCAPELMMQCAVDLAAPSPTGYCIFAAPMDGGACFNSGLTESCPPTTTCVAGECRSLCFCDADCEEGKCCAEPIGITGFNVCGDC